MELQHDVYKVLGDPHRLRMVEMLGSGEKTVGELERGVGLSQSATSQHLRLMNAAGLVTYRKEGNFRLYALHTSKLKRAMWFFNYLWDADLAVLKNKLEHNG